MSAPSSRSLLSTALLACALAMPGVALAEGGGAPAGGGAAATETGDGGAGGSTTIDEESQGPHEESGGCAMTDARGEAPGLAALALGAAATTLLRRRRVAG